MGKEKMSTSKMYIFLKGILVLLLVKTTKPECTTVCLSDLKDEIAEMKVHTNEVKNLGYLVELSAMLIGIGGPWILVQKHDFTNDATFKNKYWAEYKHGFGERDENSPEFWIGLDKMHELTESGGTWTLKIQVKYDKNRGGKPDERAGTFGVGEWPNFKVGSEADKYRLNIGKKTKGKDFPKDPFSDGSHNGMGFTTAECDND